MATNILLPRAIWIGTYWFYDIRLVSCPLPVSVLPAVMGYKMIANQMAGLLGHPVSVLPALHWFAYCQMVHQCFKCLWPRKCTLVNGSAGYNVQSMFTCTVQSLFTCTIHVHIYNSVTVIVFTSKTISWLSNSRFCWMQVLDKFQILFNWRCC